MNTKSNRSVQRTKKNLRRALAQLLLEKPVQQITVRELAELADVNRGTFYLHYKDVFDMAEVLQQEITDKLADILGKYPADRLRSDIGLMIGDIYRFIEANADLALPFMGQNGGFGFQTRIREIVAGKLTTDWPLLFGHRDAPRYGMYTHYITSGCIGMMMEWTQQGMQPGIDEMVAMTQAFILKGVMALEP